MWWTYRWTDNPETYCDAKLNRNLTYQMITTANHANWVYYNFIWLQNFFHHMSTLSSPTWKCPRYRLPPESKQTQQLFTKHRHDNYICLCIFFQEKVLIKYTLTLMVSQMLWFSAHIALYDAFSKGKSFSKSNITAIAEWSMSLCNSCILRTYMLNFPCSPIFCQ